MDDNQYLNQADLKGLLFSVIANDVPENDIINAIQKLITELKADISLKNKCNQTLLFQASLNAQTHVVQFLLENGSSKNIDEKDKLYHWTALMAAAIDGNPKIIQILLNYGADIKAEDFLKRTAFQHSIQHNNTHAIHCFLNLMSKEELEAFSKKSEDNRILVEGFNEALLKNAYILRQHFRKKINICDTEKNHFGALEGIPEIMAHIHRLQVLLEAPNTETFDPWYAMSPRIKQHTTLFQNHEACIPKIDFHNNSDKASQNENNSNDNTPALENASSTKAAYSQRSKRK